MDTWYFNKIAGGVLSALLVAFGAGTLAEIVHSGHGDSARKPGYELPVTAAVATGGAAAPVFKFADVAGLLKSASTEAGREVFSKCRSCHTSDKGDNKTLQGPPLWGIVGRNAAGHPGFNYSPALKGMQGGWTFEKLAGYLNDPRGSLPGNRMSFPGISDNTDLASVLVYLRSLSDAPAPLPN